MPRIDNYVGRLPDGRDVRAFLRQLDRPESRGRSLVLMEYVDGIEMGVGAYFDGEQVPGARMPRLGAQAVLPGDLGELTGEMGTVVTYRPHRSISSSGRWRAWSRCCATTAHCGYVNLNTIVNEQGIWPLEFTCRFGYPGFAILDSAAEDRLGRAVGGDGRRDRARRSRPVPASAWVSC